jgi:hypothetical protein
MDVVGLYRGRRYVARLTTRGIWIVQCDGPVIVFPALEGEEADVIRCQVERLLELLPMARCAEPGIDQASAN